MDPFIKTILISVEPIPFRSKKNAKVTFNSYNTQAERSLLGTSPQSILKEFSYPGGMPGITGGIPGIRGGTPGINGGMPINNFNNKKSHINIKELGGRI